VKYAAHIYGIYAAYAACMRNIFSHISGIYNFKWCTVLTFSTLLIQRLIANTDNRLPPNIFNRLKTKLGKKNVIA